MQKPKKEASPLLAVTSSIDAHFATEYDTRPTDHCDIQNGCDDI